MEENNLKDSFEKELEKIKMETILSPEYKRKKTIVWAVRTVIAICLFFFLWEHKWVRWALIAYIPLNFFSLISIYGGSALLNRKINRTHKKIEALDELINENE